MKEQAPRQLNPIDRAEAMEQLIALTEFILGDGRKAFATLSAHTRNELEDLYSRLAADVKATI
ncbi:hypothetical protein [Paraburkholderia adhaesiva]|uniref:hypothetical protein n=1 Tax=Paraburkholderia adhaesiva TaxID=2883244 RepID=UPI001F1E22E6|nr:hypothetical protein [Paraburkholderia adhaesiva]